MTVLLHMRRTENGIAFCKTTRNAVVMREKVLPYRLYPVTHLCWNRVRGSCHGESPLTEAIPNQIAINKLYSMYVQCIKQVAFPKIVYDMTRFPNGWSNDVGKAIGMRGNPNEAIAAAFRAPDISAQVLQLLKQMMTDTAELMGASEAALGTVNPDNTSAIIAVQNATAAPLELTKMEFYRFTEDWARVFLDLMGAHYGVRTLVLPNEDGGEPETCTFDFSALAGQDMRLQVDVGAASYWSETMQTMTNDHLLESGVISDPLVYLENVPDYQVRGKHDLLHALRSRALLHAATAVRARRFCWRGSAAARWTAGISASTLTSGCRRSATADSIQSSTHPVSVRWTRCSHGITSAAARARSILSVSGSVPAKRLSRRTVCTSVLAAAQALC